MVKSVLFYIPSNYNVEMEDQKVPVISRKYASSVLLFLLKNDNAKKGDLIQVVHSNTTVDKLVRELEIEGFISVSSEFAGRRTYKIQLTNKGRKIAEQLKLADNIEKGIELTKYEIPEDFGENFRNMSAMVHFNVKDDHVAVTEHNFDGSGNERIVYIYTRPNGHNILRLWCDVDKSFDCKHTQFAWTLPDVQEMVEIKFKDLKK